MTSADAIRQWRSTARGRQSVRARSLAQAAAAKWVIAEHPDVWKQMMADARVAAGLPPESVNGRPPATRSTT